MSQQVKAMGRSEIQEAVQKRVQAAQMCEYGLPVSDACNARLMPPAPHAVALLAAAAQHQVVADFYTGSFNDPDRFWHIASRPERTDVIKQHLIAGTLSAKPLEWDAIDALADAGALA